MCSCTWSRRYVRRSNRFSQSRRWRCGWKSGDRHSYCARIAHRFVGQEASMKSMTGYGSGVGAFPGGRVSVELRAVNHRFLEIKMPLPREFLPWESEFRTAIEDQIKRGRVEMLLTTVGRPA